MAPDRSSVRLSLSTTRDGRNSEKISSRRYPAQFENGEALPPHFLLPGRLQALKDQSTEGVWRLWLQALKDLPTKCVTPVVGSFRARSLALPVYDSKMRHRRKHHLPAEVFEGQHHIVSVTVSTANRGQWAADPSLTVVIREEILVLHNRYPIVGFCVMPDHVHILLCNAGSTLGKIMNGFKGRTSRRVRQGKPGLAVWQSGYWDHVVRKEEGLYATLRYIFLNPVRASLVKQWWDYEWLGSPLLGEVGPELFDCVSPEDIVWRDLVSGNL
ncbi:MAG: hypothetical protein DRJ65_11700 [Acidobacteria bacterium]|nr:MAG: hypothetical protein DRJ65_11700 [Acidobacteriota bacterium]